MHAIVYTCVGIVCGASIVCICEHCVNMCTMLTVVCWCCPGFVIYIFMYVMIVRHERWLVVIAVDYCCGWGCVVSCALLVMICPMWTVLVL